MRIRLLGFDAEGVADDILSGKLPPTTDNKEVIQAIARRVAEENLDVEFWRWDDRGLDFGYGFREISYSQDEVKQLGTAYQDNWPEPRPIGQRQPDDNQLMERIDAS